MRHSPLTRVSSSADGNETKWKIARLCSQLFNHSLFSTLFFFRHDVLLIIFTSAFLPDNFETWLALSFACWLAWCHCKSSQWWWPSSLLLLSSFFCYSFWRQQLNVSIAKVFGARNCVRERERERALEGADLEDAVAAPSRPRASACRGRRGKRSSVGNADPAWGRTKMTETRSVAFQKPNSFVRPFQTGQSWTNTLICVF